MKKQNYQDYQDDQADQAEQKKPEPKSIAFRLSDYSPNTHMIMGALFSGGDPLKMAKILCEMQGDPPEEPDDLAEIPDA